MRRLAALLLGCLLAAAAAELGVRLSGAEWALLEPLVPRQVSDAELYTSLDDPVLLYGLRPGLDLTLDNGSPWTDAPRRVRTRELAATGLGLRDPERSAPKPDDVLRVLCVGGSHTFGPAVSDDETWPAALEGALADRGVIAEAWNLGVSGYMGRQKVALVEAVLAQVDADLVLFQLYNEGRRFVHLDAALPWRMATAPGLYAEYVADAPEPWAWWMGSSLGRALLIGRHRLLLRDPATDPTEALLARARRLDDAAVRAFAETSDTPVLFMTPPAGAEVPQGVELIDLHAMDQPFGEEGRDLHPGPRVYAWEAERIAQRLMDLGFRPSPPAPR